MMPYRIPSFRTGIRMLCGKDGKRNSDTEWRIYYAGDSLSFSSPRQQILHIRSEWHLMFSVIMMLSVPLSLWCLASLRHYDALPYPVIQNGDKDALWERRKTEQWHGVKNLLPWWRLTGFLTTGADPSSHSFRMTPFVLRHSALLADGSQLTAHSW